MRAINYLFTIAVLFACSTAFGDVADFEDVPAGKIPATPFESGGLLFESFGLANAVFSPDILPGANNGTQAFAWCGSNCSDGNAEIITVSQAGGDLFDLTSIDAGNLLPFGFGPGEWAPGMTVRVEGFFDGGGSIFESLSIDENVFSTFALSGFTGLERLEITAPPILKDGPSGNPDPVIDNLVWNISSSIPEPGSTVVASFLLLGCAARRRRI